VQSVVVDDQDALWVLDPTSPKTEAVVKGGSKLVKIDLAKNKVTQSIIFDENVAPERSYLNDVRVDTRTGHAFITESGTAEWTKWRGYATTLAASDEYRAECPLRIDPN
jgi:DNA-binding beta-propeller fold protein YncE